MNHNQKLTEKWQVVLESQIGRPLKNAQTASVIASLLETQSQLNKGTMLESAQVTSDVAVYQQYALPLIRRQFPELLAMNVVSTIPTSTPQGVYFALRYLYDNASTKTTQFRNGKKQEIGYDLVGDYAGTANGAFTTADGEKLSLYVDDAGINGVGAQRDEAQGGAIKTASVTVLRGSILVGTRAIKTHYTLEMQQDLAAVHGQDIEAIMLEALQYEIQQEIDREILAALKYVAQNAKLGGDTAISVDLSTVAGEWDGQKIAGGVANVILSVAQQIAVATRMGAGNFVIASPGVVAALSTLNTGLYNPGPYMGAAIQSDAAGAVAQVGTLLGGQIAVYRDVYAGNEEYALVGYKGAKVGESGIIFMPYIPYIFTKTAGQDDGSPRLIVKSRYAIVANLLGSGQFYRMVKFVGLNGVLHTNFGPSATLPFNVTPTGGATTNGTNLGGISGGAHTNIPATAEGDLVL